MAEKTEKTQKLYKTSVNGRETAERLFRESGIEFEGDFFEHAMKIYELQQMRNGLGAGYQKKIAQLEYCMKTVVDSFNDLINTEAGERLKISEGYEEKITGLASEISAQQDEINELGKKLKESAQQSGKLVDDNAELRKHAFNIENLNVKNEEILLENKQRIERLSKLVADGQDAVIQKQELEIRISEILKISEQQARELNEARKGAEETRERFNETLRRLEDTHADKLQSAAERADIALEKAVLAVRRELTDQADKERAELTKQLQMVESSHSSEIRKLYDEVDKLRQQLASVKQPASTKPKKNEAEE